MAEPIVASYVQVEHDWTVTVSGYGKELTGDAPGIIAARDRADELVADLGPDAAGATVVHLLNGSALEFTAAYMTARLARHEEPAATPDDKDDRDSPDSRDIPDSAQEGPGEPAEKPAEEPRPAAERKPQSKSARRPRAKLTADIGDALTAARPKPSPEPASVKAESRVAEAAAQGS